ncbi:MAG: diphosphomevalonate decarboxylase [Candidatus Thermoplasmatota archaeon]|nr:diphosphomevalonate decarboxylase [Candidatus Thermoplasmatota archaeon]
MPSLTVKAVAHPTMGIVLLGGLSDPVLRLPYHNSAGICYSLDDRESVSETTLTITGRQLKNTLNGEPISENDSRSPFKFIDIYRDEMQRKFKGNIYFNSENRNIISGSSDAGAAALGKCISWILPGIDQKELEMNMRKVSESAGRSYHGGLTVTEGTQKPFTRKILDESSFENYRILSVVFPHKRKPSDDIHFNQPRSDYYKKRIMNATKNVETLKELARKNEVKKIFELAMADTDDYHYLNDLVNVNIITDEMRALMERVREIRKRMWATYIVTGGNSVFLVTDANMVEKAKEIAMEHSREVHVLKVAGGARVVDTKEED